MMLPLAGGFIFYSYYALLKFFPTYIYSTLHANTEFAVLEKVFFILFSLFQIFSFSIKKKHNMKGCSTYIYIYICRSIDILYVFCICCSHNFYVIQVYTTSVMQFLSKYLFYFIVLIKFFFHKLKIYKVLTYMYCSMEYIVN